MKTFFTSSRFAVVGASSDPTKFGHKGSRYCLQVRVHSSHFIVFVWYLQHSLPVTPINPRASEVIVRKQNYATVSSPSALQSPADTSLSIITPPKVTLSVLKEAKAAGILAVWLQPGSFDDEVMAFAKKEFKAAIGGFESDSGTETNGGEGWCVLVDGEDGLSIAGRKWERQKL